MNTPGIPNTSHAGASPLVVVPQDIGYGLIKDMIDIEEEKEGGTPARDTSSRQRLHNSQERLSTGNSGGGNH